MTRTALTDGTSCDRKRSHVLLTIAASLMVLTISCIAAARFGAAPLSARTVAAVFADRLGFRIFDASLTPAAKAIVWDLRVPRVLMGAVAGGGLAVVGGVLQVVTRNPLADPYLFGISAGASVGAVLVILYAGSWATAVTLPAGAFVGAAVALLLVLAASRGRARAATSERLVLMGVAVAFMLSALTNFLIVGAADRGAEVALFWMMGGLSTARWQTILVPAATTCVGVLWLVLRAPVINPLAFGDDTARSLGIDAARVRVEVFVVTALMTGAIVAVAGGIGFVGLVIPHVVRLVTGGDLRRLLPWSTMLGALFLTWVNVVARVAFAPRDIPLGIVTSSIGGLFFLWLVWARKA